jgi:hypothetical protein
VRIGVALLVALAAAVGSTVAEATASARAIPSLHARTVYRTLAAQDFVCSGPAKKAGQMKWTCIKKAGSSNYSVTLTGNSATQLTNIRGSATIRASKPKPVAASFVGYVATIPYKGANPNKARAWATRHIGGGKMKIGPVTFTIGGSAQRPTIELTG